MIAALLIQAVAPAPALPPQDWSTLPALRYVKTPSDRPELANFVRNEVKSGHCAAPHQTATGWALTVDVAVLVSPLGLVRRTVPRAIDCPAVEQYAAGLAFSRAMGNIDADGVGTDSWYRTSMAFAWSE